LVSDPIATVLNSSTHCDSFLTWVASCNGVVVTIICVASLQRILNHSNTTVRGFMYHHVKKLMYTVRVDAPDPAFGNMLLEQFGGANGELAAAMQYSIQGLNCDDLERKDLLMDIGTEELSHLEIVGALARLHLKPMRFNRDAAEADPLIAIAGGGG